MPEKEGQRVTKERKMKLTNKKANQRDTQNKQRRLKGKIKSQKGDKGTQWGN